MENNLPASNPTLTGKLIKFIIPAVIVAILAVIFFFWKNILPKIVQINPPGTTGSGKLIAKAGKESFYYQDLQNFAKADNYSMLPKNSLASPESSSSALVQFYLDNMIDQSIALQEGQKQGLITVDDKLFSTAPKDQTERRKLIVELVKKIDDQIETVNAEAIVLYSGNNPSLVKLKANETKDKLVSGQTFETAGKGLASDTSLINASNLNNNPFRRLVKVSKSNPLFANSSLTEQLFSLPVNQLSSVIEVTSAIRDYPKATFTSKKIAYLIFKVSEHHQGQYSSFYDWLIKVKKNYKINKLI